MCRHGENVSKKGQALNRVTLGGPEATASGCRRHRRFTDQLQRISNPVIITGPFSLHLLSLRDPDEVSSGPPTGSSCHDVSQRLNSETVSGSRHLLFPRGVVRNRTLRTKLSINQMDFSSLPHLPFCSSSARRVAASMVSIRIPRTPARSITLNPAIVVPPGDVMRSFSSLNGAF